MDLTGQVTYTTELQVRVNTATVVNKAGLLPHMSLNNNETKFCAKDNAYYSVPNPIHIAIFSLQKTFTQIEHENFRNEKIKQASKANAQAGQFQYVTHHFCVLSLQSGKSLTAA